MNRIIHCAIDLDYIIHRNGAHLMVDGVVLPGESRPATLEAIIAHATILKARGFEVMPTCENYDARGYCICGKVPC